MDADTLCDRGVIIAGDPESCIKGVQLYEDIGVDQVILIMQTETVPHERVLQSIELFGKHVLPAFGKGVKAKTAAAAR
jgi:alkanesulfonate monooxygenase SsuD/methylene tetrahydromethanopterin reductase-like flavin-dependent oxidoreductase (luciferase family)